MKRIIILILILIVISATVTSEESLYSKIYNNELKTPKNDVWERIKIEVFKNGENKRIQKYTGPVLFKINNATAKDSLAFNQVFSDLRALLPNKEIDYFNSYTKTKDAKDETDSLYTANLSVKGYQLNFLHTFAITLNFQEKEIADLIDGEPITVNAEKAFGHFSSITNNSQTKSTSGYVKPNVSLSFNKITHISRRKAVIENIVYRLLSGQSFFISDKYITNKISKSDKLVLQKLYADDFLDQFKAYMYKTYPWRYANYVMDKGKATQQALIIVFGIGIFASILIFSLFYNRNFKYSFLSYFFPVLFFWFYCTNLIWLYTSLTDFNAIIDYMDVVAFQLLIIPLFALASSTTLYLLEKTTIKETMTAGTTLILKTVYTFIALHLPVVLIYLFDGKHYKHENVYQFFLPLFYVIVGISLVRSLLIYLNHFSASLIRQKELELSQLKEANALAEVRLLQSQINPHFLYNALNSIASLAPVDTQKTQQMAHSLSNLFKYTIDKKNKGISSINDEVKLIKNYLEVEQIRFGDRLQFHIEIDKKLLGVKIPQFLIQPLVENAIKHGVSKIEGKGTISLQIRQAANGSINIIVKDNGPGFPDGLVSGHGLQTIYDLLRLNYNKEAAIDWQNTPEKAIIIHLPKLFEI